MGNESGDYRHIRKRGQKEKTVTVMKIMFCLPGREHSSTFLKCWTDLVQECNNKEIEYELKQGYSSMVHQARSLCLEGVPFLGENQKPFLGRPYDYIMWIDSDMVFKPEDVFRLIQKDKDIISGLYKIHNSNNSFAARKKAIPNNTRIKNIGYIEEITELYPFITEQDVRNTTEPISVDYIGMGFVLIKRGVIEKLKYPWFRSEISTLYVEEENISIKELNSEDSQFCFDLKLNGFDIWIDPTVRVGHEKTTILY